MYAHNRSAFAQASKSSSPLVAVYASLVHLELALKASDDSFYQHKHDVCTMLEGYGRVASLVVQFKQHIRLLHCTSKLGKPDRVAHYNYPALRYLRHTDDHDQDASDDEALRTIAGIVDDIKALLRRHPDLRPYL